MSSSKSSLRTIRKEKDPRKQTSLLITKVEPAKPEDSITGPLRPQSLKEKSDFLRRMMLNPKCPKCDEIIWTNEKETENHQKKRAVVKHGLKKHLVEEMKVCYLSRGKSLLESWVTTFLPD